MTWLVRFRGTPFGAVNYFEYDGLRIRFESEKQQRKQPITVTMTAAAWARGENASKFGDSGYPHQCGS
jgi:hypothetical protein